MSSYLLNVYNRSPIKIVKGEGAYLYDDSGKRYLDFAAGIATVALGHCHPYLNQVINDQSKKLWHCSNLFSIPEQERLAKRLVNLTFADRVFFCSTGLEATEAAIKFIRRYHYMNGNKERNKIITIEGGFHGRSIAAISAGGDNYIKEGYNPLLAGFIKIPRNDVVVLENALNENIAGIFLELIQSEGGVYPLDIEYLTKIRELTNKNGILLAFDEVQTGYGRTGELFYYKKIGIEPDVLTCAKSMGNGFPIAACLLQERISNVMKPRTHGSTYGGNPLAMSVGNAVLDIMIEPQFFPQVAESINYLHKSLSTINNKFHSLIKEVRKEGFLIGIEFYDHISVSSLIDLCLENGLIMSKTANINTIRLVPPIIINKLHINEFTEKMTSSLSMFRCL